MEFFLLTRDECKKIAENTEAFYCTTTTVNGYDVEMYDYRLASLTDFTDNKAFELRGLTFVKDPATGLWDRNILLNKFFNVGQTIGWLLDDVKDKRIVRVQDKLDGSVISFVRFPDGSVRGKSKMSFTSTQAEKAQELYEANDNIKQFVNYMLDLGIVPIFEYISMHNQIVVPYGEDELRLIQLREKDTGEYYRAFLMNDVAGRFNITTTEDFDEEYHDLNYLLVIKETSKRNDMEGFVVTFEDGQMAKIKTDHYLVQHGLVGPDAFRENLLIEAIVNESIDDVISALVEGPKKTLIVDMTNKVQHHFNHLIVEYKRLRGEFFNKYNEDRKEFALKYSNKHEMFGAVMKTSNTSFRDIEETAKGVVKQYILNKTKSLGDAKSYLEKL